jgi:hypothetical protein
MSSDPTFETFLASCKELADSSEEYYSSDVKNLRDRIRGHIVLGLLQLQPEQEVRVLFEAGLLSDGALTEVLDLCTPFFNQSYDLFHEPLFVQAAILHRQQQLLARHPLTRSKAAGDPS